MGWKRWWTNDIKEQARCGDIEGSIGSIVMAYGFSEGLPSPTLSSCGTPNAYMCIVVVILIPEDAACTHQQLVHHSSAALHLSYD